MIEIYEDRYNYYNSRDNFNCYPVDKIVKNSTEHPQYIQLRNGINESRRNWVYLNRIFAEGQYAFLVNMRVPNIKKQISFLIELT